MLKKCPAFPLLSFLLAVTFSTRVCAASSTAAPPGENSALVLAAVILLGGVIIAYTVMSIMKRKKFK